MCQRALNVVTHSNFYFLFKLGRLTLPCTVCHFALLCWKFMHVHRGKQKRNNGSTIPGATHTLSTHRVFLILQNLNEHTPFTFDGVLFVRCSFCVLNSLYPKRARRGKISKYSVVAALIYFCLVDGW